MGDSLRLVIGLLACLAFASALPAIFPREKITTYRYYAEVQSEAFDPTSSWASQFVISGLMHVTPEISDPNLKNAFYVSLDVTHGLRNGRVPVSEKIAEDRLKPIPDAAKALKDPFVVVFDDSGKIKGLKVNKNEAEWSRNMKKSIASMLQLDLSSILLQTPMAAQNFSTNENTVYGLCTVDYNIKSEPEQGTKMFVVKKSINPLECTKFSQHTFNSIEAVDDIRPKKNNLGASSERIFDIENNGNDLLIKKLVARGLMHYTPRSNKSNAHYVIASQTMDFESSVPVGGITLPPLNMGETVSLNDVTFQKPQSKYADKAGLDFTYGRHVVNAEDLVTKLIEILGEATDYVKENHSEMNAPDMKHGQAINRILDTMSYMDITSLENVANRIRDETLEKRDNIQKLFLQMLPYVGTDATCLYIQKIIRNREIPDAIAFAMLTKLPYYARTPTEELLIELEGLTSFGNDVSSEVQKAGVLAFATLIHKAHKYEEYHHPLNPELVSRYVNRYFGHVMNETSYGMKLLYIQAMKNIGTPDVFRLLEPIVSGNVSLSEKPQHLRFTAMIAYVAPYPPGVDIDKIFWPILENTESPLEIRAAALAIIVKQPPTNERFMRLLVLMTHEQNKHLYNYCYTTLKSFADSTSLYWAPIRDMAREVLDDSRIRRPASADLLSSVESLEYENKEFGFAEGFMAHLLVDEHTGTPFYGGLEYSSTDGESPTDQITFFLRVEGFDDLIGSLPWAVSAADLASPIEKIENLLKKASRDMPAQKPIHIEFSVMYQGRFIISEYFDRESLPDAVVHYFTHLFMEYLEDPLFWNDVEFERLYTKLVTNDFGLPTVFETKIPSVTSMHENIVQIMRGLKIEAGVKYWSHGYQSMAVYNPIIDTWHAARRVSAVDSNLPFAMSLKFAENVTGITATFPRLPTTQYSVSYVRTYNKDYVMVVGGKKDVLELYCPNCNLTEMVMGSEGREENSVIASLDSKDTGLMFSVQQYDCDVVSTAGEDLLTFDQTDTDYEDMEFEDLLALGLLVLREHQLHAMAETKMKSCGYLYKLEPSHVYPTSEIEFSITLEGSTGLPKKLSLPPAIDVNLNVSLITKAESTKDVVRSWTMTGFWNSTEGYLHNDMQLDFTRRTAGENDLKLCIDTHKTYPPTVSDPFSRAVIPNSKTTEQFRLRLGETTTEACPSEGLLLRVDVEGSMSDEQKEALEHGEIHDACQRDVDNPLYMYAESSIVPRTPACLREALLRTTLRHYVFNVFHHNVPEDLLDLLTWVDNTFNSIVSSNSTSLAVLTEPGNVQIIVDFPLNSKGVNLTIRTPAHETKYIDRFNVDDEGWEDVMDNIYFSSDVLESIHDKEDRFCAIYPEVVINTDGAITPFTVPGQWTLVTGDYKNYLFSVFVKSIAPKKLGLLITVTNHTIEIIPTDTNPTLTVDGNVISYDHDLVIPEYEDEDDSLAYRVIWSPNPKRFLIESAFSAFDLEWTERSVSLVLSTVLQGQVTGLCGHLDGTYKGGLAKVYTIEE